MKVLFFIFGYKVPLRQLCSWNISGSFTRVAQYLAIKSNL